MIPFTPPTEEVTMTRTIDCIAYHTAQAAYSARVRTPQQLRARILHRHRQARLNGTWGLRTIAGRRDVTA